jgi:very-short-patch-repair endonuclease
MADNVSQAQARQLRRHMTLPEVLLWRLLKNRGAGFRFRRQHPLGPYILDFYCPERRLVLEIDGIGHDMGDRPQRDKGRDAWLAERGLRVVRIPATDVLQDSVAVAEAIRLLCSDRS